MLRRQKMKRKGNVNSTTVVKKKKINMPVQPDSESDGESKHSEVDSASDNEQSDSHSDSGSDVAETNEEEVEKVSDTETAPPASKKAKVKKSNLYDAPTNEELNQLREAENLTRANLLRLQTTGLLAEVNLKEKLKASIDGYVATLGEVMVGLKCGKTYDLSDVSWLKKHKIKCPIDMTLKSTKGTFTFKPPCQVTQTGSYSLDIALKNDLTVDVSVEMPKDCFQDKDYLNQRYLRKRALYQAAIACRLKGSELVEEMWFAYDNENPVKPDLVIKPAAKFGKNFTVRLQPFAEEGSFKLNRFDINKNNIRSKWFDASEMDSDESDPPTPHYNTWVLQDLVRVDNQSYVEHVIGKNIRVREGIKLLKVWLRQRQLDQGLGCFSGYVMTMYVTHLLSKRKLNTMMTSFQIMRNTLVQLSESDWINKGLSLAPENTFGQDAPSLPDHHRVFDVVFVDRTGFVNLCSDMLEATYLRVKHEAQLSIQLTETSKDTFQILLMTPVNFFMAFDHIFKVPNLEVLSECISKLDKQSEVMGKCGDQISVCVDHFLKLLKKALGERVKLIGIEPEPYKKWVVTSKRPKPLETKTLTFGLLINPDAAYGILEKGPAADSQEASEFRDFWGKLSELRRFQDGSICEAAVWRSSTVADKRKVLAKIVKHILQRHADLPKDNIKFMSHHLDPLLMLARSKTQQKTVLYGTGEEQSQEVQRRFDDLAKILRNLKDLPLTIHTIQAVSPVSRYAEVFPPVAIVERQIHGIALPNASSRCPTWNQPIKVLCMLEASGKWPDDIEAVKRVKAAFLIKIKQLLQEDHDIIAKINTEFLDVFKDGLVFRVEIGYMKEISLLKMFKTADGMLKMLDNSEATKLQQRLVAQPKLTSTLNGLQLQNSSLSSVVCMAKRWVSAHLLLDGYVNEEAVELLVAYLYLQPAPYTQPNSTLTGFMRFLKLVSSYNWQEAPLIVNINNELSRQDITEIEERFTKDRSLLPAMFIATPDDKLKSTWTSHKPIPLVLQRLVVLAKESLAVLEQHIQNTRTPDEIRQVFRPPLDSYDVLIHLKPYQLSRHHHAVDIRPNTTIPTFKDEDTKISDRRMPVVEYSPVANYLAELRETYDDIAMFFYDCYGGDMIAVVFKPNAFNSGPFRLSHLHDRIPSVDSVKKETKLEFNVEAVLEGFDLMGMGLVKKVEAKTENWKQ